MSFGLYSFLKNILSGGNAIRNITFQHSKIHSGQTFSIDTLTPGSNPLIENNTSLNLVIDPADDNYPHFIFKVKLGGEGRLFVYDLSSSISYSGGTELIPQNSKHDSDQTPDVTAFLNPTINLDGATFKEGCILLGSSGPGLTTIEGSEASFDHEIILNSYRPLYIQVLNESGGSVRACICCTYYKASKIPT